MNDADRLHGRVALLTGATGGIGLALTRRLVDEGVTVVATSRDPDALNRLTGGCSRLHGVVADMRDLDTLPYLIARVTDRYGRLDILLPNAGNADVRRLDEVKLVDWEDSFAVNLTAPFLLTQAAAPVMCRAGWGRILFTSSVAAYMGGYVGPHYAAAKAGLHGLVHHLSGELAPHGVTVNAVAPALVSDTRMAAAAPVGLPTPPVGRFGDPAEIADVATAVLRTGYLSGQVVLVDGGLHPN